MPVLGTGSHVFKSHYFESLEYGCINLEGIFKLVFNDLTKIAMFI